MPMISCFGALDHMFSPPAWSREVAWDRVARIRFWYVCRAHAYVIGNDCSRRCLQTAAAAPPKQR